MYSLVTAASFLSQDVALPGIMAEGKVLRAELGKLQQTVDNLKHDATVASRFPGCAKSAPLLCTTRVHDNHAWWTQPGGPRWEGRAGSAQQE